MAVSFFMAAGKIQVREMYPFGELPPSLYLKVYFVLDEK